jgi:dipeptidyl aminopeptidase/acylaminoacyl peptidase
MTIWTVGHTDRFKVGVPERFEIDYLSCFGEDEYFVQYRTELGSPYEHEDLYRRLSPGTYVPNIKTPLFLIADENDGNCPPSQAMQMYQRLRLRGFQTELVIYPNETHTLAYPSHVVDRLQRLLHWFGAYLR